MKLVLDMNFDESRAGTLRSLGIDAMHWTAAGDPRDLDPVLIEWAREHGHVLVTQDPGIAARLARSGVQLPSVIQLRHADDLSPALMAQIAAAARRHEADLERGCILVFDARTNRTRIRLLPAAR